MHGDSTKSSSAANLNLFEGLEVLFEAALQPYLHHLRGNRLAKKLPYEIICVAGKHYKHDLDKVRYYEDVDNTTIGDNAITFGYEIFFPKKINLTNEHDNENYKRDLGWMLHELEHVDQYKAAGGIIPFLLLYLEFGVLEMLKQRTLDIHKFHLIEQAADKKRDNIINNVMQDLKRGLSLKLDNHYFFTLGTNQSKRKKILAVNFKDRSLGVIQEKNDSLCIVWKNTPMLRFDSYITADISGNGNDEIIGFNNMGRFLGVYDQQDIGLAEPWIGRGDIGGWVLHQGDKFLAADIDRDGHDEIIVSSADGKFVGILREQNGGLTATWIGKDRLGGWMLHQGDKFLAANIDGDGYDEIIVSSADGKFVGILREQNGGLTATWIGKDRLGGWMLHQGDKFLAADIDGDGHDEIIVSSADGKFVGILREQNGGLTATWIGKDRLGGWMLHQGDKFLAADIDGDGHDEIIVSSADGKFVGILREQNGGLTATWIGKDRLGGWELNPGDRFLSADINGDGRDEIIICNADSKYLGIMQEHNGKLIVTSIEYFALHERPTKSSLMISPSSPALACLSNEASEGNNDTIFRHMFFNHFENNTNNENKTTDETSERVFELRSKL